MGLVVDSWHYTECDATPYRILGAPLYQGRKRPRERFRGGGPPQALRVTQNLVCLDIIDQNCEKILGGLHLYKQNYRQDCEKVTMRCSKQPWSIQGMALQRAQGTLFDI
jgi:hypothetical protein